MVTVPGTLITTQFERSSKAIEITATDEVVAYGINKQAYSNDAFLALPVDTLGLDYYAVTWARQRPMANILIVGVHDATSVNMTFPSASTGFTSIRGPDSTDTYGPGETMTVN